MSNKVTTVQTKITLESDCPPSKENPQYESLSLADIALLDQCAKRSLDQCAKKHSSHSRFDKVLAWHKFKSMLK